MGLLNLFGNQQDPQGGGVFGQDMDLRLMALGQMINTIGTSKQADTSGIMALMGQRGKDRQAQKKLDAQIEQANATADKYEQSNPVLAALIRANPEHVYEIQSGQISRQQDVEDAKRARGFTVADDKLKREQHLADIAAANTQTRADKTWEMQNTPEAKFAERFATQTLPQAKAGVLANTPMPPRPTETPPMSEGNVTLQAIGQQFGLTDIQPGEANRILQTVPLGAKEVNSIVETIKKERNKGVGGDEKWGITPQWTTGPDGKLGWYVLSDAGNMKKVELPAGVEPAPVTRYENTGLEWTGLPSRGNIPAVRQSVPIEVAAAANATKTGTLEAQRVNDQPIAAAEQASNLEDIHSANDVIDRLVDPKTGELSDGAARNFGITGSFPNWPGSQAADAAADIKSLGDKATILGLNAQKALSDSGASGFGSLVTHEEDLIRDSIANLGSSQSVEHAKETFRTLKEHLKVLEDITNGKYNALYGGSSVTATKAAPTEPAPDGVSQQLWDKATPEWRKAYREAQ